MVGLVNAVPAISALLPVLTVPVALGLGGNLVGPVPVQSSLLLDRFRVKEVVG